MSNGLVLSLFPGIGMLDAAFEAEGFCTVRGPDPLWGGDVRRFNPPPGVFGGIIGGDPCQSHSSLANLVRAKGLEPSFPDMTGDYQRVIDEAQPRWFLRENTPKAPDIAPVGYGVHSFKLDLSTLDDGTGWGHEQMRTRRFWFGVRDAEAPDLRKWIDFAENLLPNETRTQAVSADSRAVSVAIGGSGKPKATRTPPVTGRNEGRVSSPTKDYSPPRRDLAEMLRLQGFPEDWLKHQPWTMQAKRKMIGNGVPLPMGRALARAIREATK